MYRLWVLWAFCVSCNQPLAQPVVASPATPTAPSDAGVEVSNSEDEDASEDTCLRKIGERIADQKKLIEEIDQRLKKRPRR